MRTAAAAVRLADARLEHVQLAALDRELEVLDVAVVLLQLLADALELGVDLGHLVAASALIFGGVRMPATTSSPWALVRYSPKSTLLAGVRVAREGDAGARVVAHVAEDHRHDVDRRAQVVGDLVVLAVVAGTLAEPAMRRRP